MDSPSLSIGQVAKQVGIAVGTIRFYERVGLIEEPPRRDSGYRQYSMGVVERLRLIRRAKVLGFSLREIQDLLLLRTDSAQPCADVQSQVASKIADVEGRIADLERMKLALEELLSTCDSEPPGGACPVLEILSASSPATWSSKQ